MHFDGLIVGVVSFIIIGVFHVVVVKAEYYFTKRCWPAFLILGIACCVASVFIAQPVVSTLIAVLAFSLFWSIKELFEQEQRVAKGWAKANPKRTPKSPD